MERKIGRKAFQTRRADRNERKKVNEISANFQVLQVIDLLPFCIYRQLSSRRRSSRRIFLERLIQGNSEEHGSAK